MVRKETDRCPKCGGQTKYYDYVIRKIKRPEGGISHRLLSRVKCTQCKSVHRVIPDDIIPYKQYSRETIESNRLFLDFPSDSTVKRWHAKKSSSLMKTKMEDETDENT